jgi:DNA-binding GntR family transcriptional regulator
VRTPLQYVALRTTLDEHHQERPSALRALWRVHAGAGAVADAAYNTLREAILAGHLRPGDRLGEEQLAREFGVSRTPIREAIFRLEAEHFAIRVVRRGLVVRTIPEEQVLEVYTVRASLDRLAARLAAEHATVPDRARLHWLNEQIRVAAERGDHSYMAELNIQFHEAMCEAAHNGMLLHFMREIHDWVRRFGETTFSRPGRAVAAIAEHRAIVEAVDRGDAEAAGKLASDHMNRARETRLAMLRDAADELSTRPGARNVV